MRKLLLVGSFALACISSISAQIRFVDNVIDRSNISVTKNVTYAQNYTVLYGDMDTTKAGPQFMLESLKMDIYAPNDGSSNRPLIIYLHTGSFLPRYINNTPTGAKDDSATVEM
jgi:acetyl esterase/lipase